MQRFFSPEFIESCRAKIIQEKKHSKDQPLLQTNIELPEIQKIFDRMQKLLCKKKTLEFKKIKKVEPEEKKSQIQYTEYEKLLVLIDDAREQHKKNKILTAQLIQLKKDIVGYVKKAWPLLERELAEAIRISKEVISENDIVIGLNSCTSCCCNVWGLFSSSWRGKRPELPSGDIDCCDGWASVKSLQKNNNELREEIAEHRSRGPMRHCMD